MDAFMTTHRFCRRGAHRASVAWNGFVASAGSVGRYARREKMKLAACVLCAVVVATSLFARGASATAKLSPYFIARTVTGETFTSESVKGKIVLVQFWTTGCQFCRDEQQAVDRIDRAYRNEDVVVLAVNVGESKKKVAKYLASHPRSCRVVLTHDTNLPAIYSAAATPMYVVIGRDGRIAGMQRGAGGENALRCLLHRAGVNVVTTAPDVASAQ